MEIIDKVTCERCGTEHEIVRMENGELAIKHGSNINFSKTRKNIISCVKCRAFMYIGDKLI